ncbi:predicted protein [Arabidopsis lyrata subsp. lyrata]|uniref:Predicted protein n=1 Tax=Arabidopsis lyrata subsp. lyrata TaxID=81972 RepID=D7MQR6_ARALL|nr:predicted protein [Arabidopsis lyrata subsp. lyrata]
MDPRRNEHYRGSTNDSKGFLSDRPWSIVVRTTLEISTIKKGITNLKQRHDESVATSSWLPKSSSFQDEEARNYKLQRFNSGGNRDARQVLDKKRSSYQAPKESIKEYSRENPSPRKSARTHLTYMEKGKEAAVASLEVPSLTSPKVISPLENKVQGKPVREPISKEEELQIQKELDEMKERNLALSAEENKILQEKADELYALTMHQEEIDNDDLLDDGMQNAYMQLSGERTKDSPLSKSAHIRKRAETRRRVSQSPLELPGVASKKRNILPNGPPKKRSENKSQTLRSRTGKPSLTIPRIGVFQSSTEPSLAQVWWGPKTHPIRINEV